MYQKRTSVTIVGVSVDSLGRLERISGELAANGRVRVTDLATALDVSEMTIRRDLDTLVESGVAQRIRGGALARGPQPFADRFGRQAKAKDRIADKLVALLGEGGAVGFDASSTLQRLASRLDETRDLTVVTNSLESFGVMSQYGGVTALITGGQLDQRTGSLVGPLATRAARDLLLRRLFVSAAGVDPVHGTTESTLEEAEVKQALLDVSGHVVVAVDSTKLGQRGSARCIPIERIDVIVTELDPGDIRLDPYRQLVELR